MEEVKEVTATCEEGIGKKLHTLELQELGGLCFHSEAVQKKETKQRDCRDRWMLLNHVANIYNTV